MPYEIEYKLGGDGDPHLHRLPRMFWSVDEALETLGKFVAILPKHVHAPGMELKVFWVDDPSKKETGHV
jgi:hypothetical protein